MEKKSAICQDAKKDVLLKCKRSFKMDGPDGGWAWCVALAACLITFITAGIARTSGFFYVSFITTFGVSRKGASVPFSIRSSTKNLLGPVVGILGQQYGVRAVVLAGGVVASISCASCYFASNMDMIIVFWGLFGGIGSSLTVTLIQVVIGQHFKDHHSTASGLAFSGGCIGSFILPALVEYLIHGFGLQGAFLVLSGIVMNIIPAALILKKPAWIVDDKKLTGNTPLPLAGSGVEDCQEDASLQVARLGDNAAQGKAGRSQPLPDVQDVTTDVKIYDDVGNTEGTFVWFLRSKSLVVRVLSSLIVHADPDLIGILETAIADENIIKSDETDVDTLGNMVAELLGDIYSEAEEADENGVSVQLSETSSLMGTELTFQEMRALDAKNHFCERMEELLSESMLDSQVSQLLTAEGGTHLSGEDLKGILLEIVRTCRLYRQVMRDAVTQREVVVNVDEKAVLKDGVNGDVVNNLDPKPAETKVLRKEGLKGHLKTTLRLYRNPIFLLVCLCRTVHFITFVPFVMVIVDFGIDKGVTEEDGVYLIAALSAGDLFGRLGLGWVTDRNLLKMPRYMLIGMVIQGAATLALPFMGSSYPLMAMASIFGILEGSLFIRHPVIISKYMASDEHSIAMGCINFFSGLVGLALPAYIGYCRDTLGSYDQMFYITGSLVVSVGLLWIFEPQFLKCLPEPRPTGDTARVDEPTVLPDQ